MQFFSRSKRFYRVSSAKELKEALGSIGNNTRGRGVIFITEGSEIYLDEPLLYSGFASVEIRSEGALIAASDSFATSAGEGQPLITFNTNADIKIKGIEFDGNNGLAQHAIEVDVPVEAKGTINVVVDNVEVFGMYDHGIHVDDQIGETGQGGDSQAGKDDLAGNNSDASIRVKIINSEIHNNGIYVEGLSDSDGVRIDEGGKGTANVQIINSDFYANGADGLEIDETGDGDVRLSVIKSTFNNNGPFDLNDTDDGLDVDESGGGSLYAKIIKSEFNYNFDEGLDLDEAGAGSIHLTMIDSEANGNGNGELVGATDLGGTGVKLSEEQEGDIYTWLINVEANHNYDYGIRLEQFGGGELDAVIFGGKANSNQNKDGVRLESYQSDDGAEIEVLDTINAAVIGFQASSNAESGVQADGLDGLIVVKGGNYSGNEEMFKFKDYSGTVVNFWDNNSIFG